MRTHKIAIFAIQYDEDNDFYDIANRTKLDLVGDDWLEVTDLELNVLKSEAWKIANMLNCQNIAIVSKIENREDGTNNDLEKIKEYIKKRVETEAERRAKSEARKAKQKENSEKRRAMKALKDLEKAKKTLAQLGVEVDSMNE